VWRERVLIGIWRRHYNTVRPHGSLDYRPPAPEATQSCPPGVAESNESVRLWVVPFPGEGQDFAVPSKAGQLKVGTNSDAGWVGHLWHGQVMRSRVAHAEGAEYPEGGATVTFYSCGLRTDEGFSEVEQVGPLTNVTPGRTPWLEQVIALSDGASSAGGVDACLAAVEEAFAEREVR